MTPSSSLVLGNRLDALAGVLARMLEEEEGDPFAGRVILTASAEMKGWLLLKLAHFSSKKAVAGLKIFSWQEGVRYLLNQPGKELSYVELYLLVYEALLASEEEEIKAYGKEAKLSDLAQQIADLFAMYGYYGGEFCFAAADDWQSRLWKRLFVEGPWRAPVQLLAEPMRVREKVYCFGCDALAPIVWKALLGLRDLSIFHFSPCASYWTDLCSDRQRRAMSRSGEKRGVSGEELEQFQEYTLDSHPLLANWGKAGREALEIFEEYEMDVEEVYDPLEGKESALRVLQQDLLWNQRSQIFPDESVKINKTGASRLREVQVLYDEMLRAHQKGISFSEMLVLAPNINLYAPFIELVFSDSKRPIPYRMSGVDQHQLSWQGFKQLLRLSQSRWDAESLLVLLENGAFREKRGWDLERLDQIRSWIVDLRIHWGQNGEKKERSLSEWLGRSVPAVSRRTWVEGADRLVNSLIYLFPEDQKELPTAAPLSGMSLADADEVEELFELVFQLEKDLSLLADGSLQSPAEWAEYFSSLFTAYFPEQELGVLEEVIYALRKAELKTKGKIPFSVISYLFTRTQSVSIHSSCLHAAQMASFEPGSIVPCRALFLLGQDEESFPRRSFSSSLDRCKGLKGAPPLRSDMDRYLFLQAVCSAQDCVVISYGHISAEDGKELGPSIVLREWLSFAKETPVTSHPSFPWHRRCFEEKACQTLSLRDYRAGLIFHADKEPLQFFPPFAVPRASVLQESAVFLKHLKKVFSHPWKFYLQNTLRLWLEEPEKKDWADFELDWIQRSKVLKQGLSQDLSSVIEMREKKQQFPIGLFGQAARKNVTKAFEEWREHFQEWNILPEELNTLSFRDIPHGPFAFAPLEVPFSSFSLRLVGDVPFCSLRGPIHFGEDSFPAMLKNWPEYLAALCALRSQEIFCLRSGKIKVVPSPLDELKKCLEIYDLALQAPLPLAPQWTDALIRKQDAEELEKKFEAKRAVMEDPVYDWVFSRIQKPSAEALVADWGALLQEKLGALIELYPLGKHYAKV